MLRSIDLPPALRALVFVLAVIGFTFLLGLLFATAFAQAAVITDPTTWFASSAAWGGVVLIATAFVRANWLRNLKGNSVLLLVFGLAVGGSVIAATGFLARYGITLDATLLEAIVFGVTAGGIAAGLWDAGTGVAAARGKALGQSLAFAQLPASSTQSVSDFIVGLVKSAVSAAKLPAALVAVAPLLAQFAQSEVVLTDDLRSNLQGKVLAALRKAGLVGVNL